MPPVWIQVRTVPGGLDPDASGRRKTGTLWVAGNRAARALKETQMHQRFEKRIEKGLTKLVEGCQKKKQKLGALERRVGRLLEANSRAAGLFRVQVAERAGGGAEVLWEKIEGWRAWAELSAGCYLLRSNITDWEAEELWQAYIQLTEAAPTCRGRLQKGDLRIRPVLPWKDARGLE